DVPTDVGKMRNPQLRLGSPREGLARAGIEFQLPQVGNCDHTGEAARGELAKGAIRTQEVAAVSATEQDQPPSQFHPLGEGSQPRVVATQRGPRVAVARSQENRVDSLVG